MTNEMSPADVHGRDLEERALLLLEIYRALKDEVGLEKTVEILSKSNDRVGHWKGAWMSETWPDCGGDLKSLMEHLQELEIIHWSRTFTEGNGTLEVQYEVCPYKKAWETAGVDESDRVTLCQIAGHLGKALFEAGGLAVTDYRTWSPGQEGCCCFTIAAK